MRISRVKLTNWRNFKEADIELNYRVFIVGANASGKSNFLDAIRFLRDLVRQGGSLQEAVESRGGVSRIRCLAARGVKSDVSVGVEIANDKNIPTWSYQLTFSQIGGGISDLKAIIKSEYLKDLVSGSVHINRSANKQNKDDYLDQYTELEQATKNQNFKEFVEFLNDISYLHLIPQLIRDPKSFSKTTKGEDYFGRDFLEKIQKTNKNTQRAYLNRIEIALRSVLPNLEKLDFVPDDMGAPHFVATFKQWRGKGSRQQERQFSDGTLRFIGIFWALQDGTKPILLEEPELSLHSAVIIRLADVIYHLQKKKSGRRQVIITTHSYELLTNKGISAEEVLMITSEGEEGSKIISSASLPEVKAYLMSGEPISDIVIRRTAPRDIGQLTLFDKI